MGEKKVILGITGASGSILAQRFLESAMCDIHLVISSNAITVIEYETGRKEEVKEEAGKDGRKIFLIQKENLLELMTDLRKQGYDHLSLITAVDFRDRIELVYHLQKSASNFELLTVRTVTYDSTIDSVTSIWESANWDEREQYDMMGVVFRGHPNLKRILLPEGWVGYPLRKDYDLSKNQYVNMDDEGNDRVSFDPGDGW